MAEPGPVLLSIDQRIARVTLNRPDRLNALNHEMGAALADILEQLAADTTVRAVVLTGAGRAFLAGGDITVFKEAGDNAPAVISELIGLFHRCIRSIASMKAPVVAGVHGAVAGGGLGLALACDFVIAADDAIFVPAYIKLGTNPDGGTTWTVTRLVGRQRALEWLMLNEPKDAAAAERFGLINRVVAKDSLQAEVDTLARRIANGPAGANAALKRLIGQATTSSLDAQLDAERQGFIQAAGTADFKEGVAAFLERRQPVF
jgi:2-(1,2-epoxy-1,2-dihydrophenyl)acetyl-CoA isomerase